MPASSEVQQQAAGIALAAKRGEISVSDLEGAAKDMYDSMTQDELEDLADTEHDDIPHKKESTIPSVKSLVESNRMSDEIVQLLFEGSKTMLDLSKGDRLKAVTDFQQFEKGTTFEILSYRREQDEIVMELEDEESKVDDVWRFPADGKGIKEFEEYFEIIQ